MSDERLPLWLRFSGTHWGVRAGIVAGFFALYLALFFLVGPQNAAALRPLNLIVVILAGLFFGFRRGGLISAGIAVTNFALYAWYGLLGADPRTLVGNVLAAVLGTAAGALVGKIRDLSMTLREEVGRRQLAERRKDELSALIVHDLKNPLTAISGNAQLLSSPELSDEEKAACAASVVGSADDMNRMVMNLLDVGRAEDGELRPAKQPVDIAPFVVQIAASLKPHAEERRLRVEVLVPQSVGWADLDPDLFRRMLVNLLDNAMKYSPVDRLIQVEVGGTTDEVEVAVRDQGPGIPRGYEEKIFEKYARLERDWAIAAGQSRGLGLHFCKLAALSHGGRITVEAAPDCGSVFRIRLPRRQASA
jgi:two-component system, sensor histidine kinase and response regulator